ILAADLAFREDALGPGHHHTGADPSQMGCDLLGPLERCIHRPGPTDWIVVVKCRTAQLADLAEHGADVGPHAVDRRDVVGRAGGPAFTRRAIVTLDVDDERIVELAVRA